jgi:cell division septum initiation protein DivIVA
METAMNDDQIADRVKVLLREASSAAKTSERPVVFPGAMNPHQALQVLTMAQRTAEQHLTIANRQADKTSSDAEAAAEKIVRDAHTHAQYVRQEADTALSAARTRAEQAERDSVRSGDQARLNADEILAEARTQADLIAGDAQSRAEELEHQAQQRFEDAVGSLHAKRVALQQQIEALESFDQEYRARLTAFMQTQQRALWADGGIRSAVAGRQGAPEARSPSGVGPARNRDTAVA